MWIWFQRLLIGTLLERFGAHDVAVDASTLVLHFDSESEFQYPAFDNRLRFVGDVRATLVREVPPAALQALQRDLEATWPDLIEQIKRIPVPDRLGVTRNEIRLKIADAQLKLHFDLEAD